jgi:uncharacterized membrane protein
MARSTKLAELKVVETSGVDHPAHLHEGWLVIKSAAVEPTEASTEPQGDNVELEITQEQEVVEAPADIAKSESPAEVLRKELTDIRKELNDVRKENEVLLANRELEKATDAAHAWSILPELNPAEFAPALVELRKALPAVAATVEAVFTASARALGESGILKELGSDSKDVAADAWSKIEALANDLVATGTAPSFAKAVSVVANNNKDLYSTYLSEKGI